MRFGSISASTMTENGFDMMFVLLQNFREDEEDRDCGLTNDREERTSKRQAAVPRALIVENDIFCLHTGLAPLPVHDLRNSGTQ